MFTQETVVVTAAGAVIVTIKIDTLDQVHTVGAIQLMGELVESVMDSMAVSCATAEGNQVKPVAARRP